MHWAEPVFDGSGSLSRRSEMELKGGGRHAVVQKELVLVGDFCPPRVCKCEAGLDAVG